MKLLKITAAIAATAVVSTAQSGSPDVGWKFDEDLALRHRVEMSSAGIYHQDLPATFA